jgi:dipeptidyl aminopeptidase/acylaminoacyl peptidase
MKPVRLLLCIVLCLPLHIAAASAPLPIEDFFRDPEFRSVSLSPTGEYMTVSVPREDRTILVAMRVADMQIVGTWDYGANRHIERVRWVGENRFFMYVAFKLGRFDFMVGTPDVYASNVDGSRRADIPNGGSYTIISPLWDEPDWILVSRSVDNAFLFRLNVWDGRTRTVASAPVRFGTFLRDREGNVRYAYGSEVNGDSVLLEREGESWRELHRDAMGGAVKQPIGFAPDNERVYFNISEHGQPQGVYLVDPRTQERSLLAANENVDPSQYLWSSDDRTLLAVRFEDGLPTYSFVDAEHPESRVYAGLIDAFPNHAVQFMGISRDGRLMLLYVYSDVDPGSVYLFDRDARQARFLLSAARWLDPERLSPMRPISLTARDGLRLHGFLTLPRDSDGRNLPLILHPHGGPHGIRDFWGFNRDVQFLASRGYAVLQVNFRGSGGYGNAFERKGYRAWGTAMVDDMNDAVRWAIEQGIADPRRICTYGGSYGGFAALQTVVRDPELYRCAIGYVGVYSLPLMFRDGDIPRSDFGRNYLRRVLPEERAEQERQSPLFNLDRIRIPVMLVHGALDQRVPMSQFNQLRRALQRAGRPPEVEVVERREGHGFQKFENNVRLYREIERFLDRHIGPDAHATGT